MLIEYNGKKFDIPDYKNYRVISVMDAGKILRLEIVKCDDIHPCLYVETYYGSGGYWKSVIIDNGYYVKVEDEDKLDILTYFYSKICEGIHKYNTETR